jgi:hypothetical protein
MYSTLQKAPLINLPLHTGHAPAWVVMKNGYDIYVVNYFAESSEYPRLSPTFEKMTDSVSITP